MTFYLTCKASRAFQATVQLAISLTVLLALAGIAGAANAADTAETLSTAAESAEANVKNEKHRLNVIIILADDMFWNDPGFAGSTYHETPNLDQLARQSTVYTQAYATSPSCTPSRAALLSGVHPARHHLFTVGHSNNGPSFLQAFIAPKNEMGLKNNTWTIADLFSKQSYQTAFIGKWHAGSVQLLQHFDHAVGYFQGGHVHSHFAPWLDNKQQLTGLAPQKGQYLTDVLNREAVKFIEQAATDQAFFLMLSHYAPHTPYQSKSEDQSIFKNKKSQGLHRNPTYAGMLKAIDRGIGDIVDTLKQRGMLENTVIVFTADNGGDHVVSSAAPLRGEKSMLFEGGIRVPLLIHAPNDIESGTSAKPVSHLDLVPTLAAMAGLDNSQLPAELEGRNLLQPEQQPTALYWYVPIYAPGYSPQANQFFYRQTPAAVMRQGDWKLHHNFESGEHQLFNLAEDPGESRNLYTDTAVQDTVSSMQLKLEQFLSSLPPSTQLKSNPQFQQAEWFDMQWTKLKLTLQIELALLGDWLFEILIGDKTAIRTLIYWLLILGLLTLAAMLFVVLKLKNR